MSIIAKQSSTGMDFTPAPAGTHPAVCIDVVDLGLLKVSYGGKEKEQHKVRLVWQIGDARPDGKPFRVDKRYTLSLHEKAALRKDLESWRGLAFTEQELKGFDLEVLIGIGAFLNVIHNTKDGTTYANVTAIMRMPKGMVPPVPRDYVRVCDRNPEAPPMDHDDNYMPGDDEVPF